MEKIPEVPDFIFRPYITIKGQRKFRPDGRMWKIRIKGGTKPDSRGQDGQTDLFE